jgi:hypothetical protein
LKNKTISVHHQQRQADRAGRANIAYQFQFRTHRDKQTLPAEQTEHRTGDGRRAEEREMALAQGPPVEEPRRAHGRTWTRPTWSLVEMRKRTRGRRFDAPDLASLCLDSTHRPGSSAEQLVPAGRLARSLRARLPELVAAVGDGSSTRTVGKGRSECQIPPRRCTESDARSLKGEG